MIFVVLILEFFCTVCWQKAMELFREAFRGKHDKLVVEIDFDHGLWVALKSLNVLTDRQLCDCRNKVCHYWLLLEIFMYCIVTMVRALCYFLWQQCFHVTEQVIMTFKNYVTEDFRKKVMLFNYNFGRTVYEDCNVAVCSFYVKVLYYTRLCIILPQWHMPKFSMLLLFEFSGLNCIVLYHNIALICIKISKIKYIYWSHTAKRFLIMVTRGTEVHH